MKLTITQRLQLSFLLGEQEGNAGDIRALSKIMDKIQVTDEEIKTIKLGPSPEGRITWDAKLGAEESDIDLSADQQVRIKRVIEKWPKFKPSDSAWLGPVLDQLE